MALAQKVAEAAVKSTDKPVTVKMRLGWDNEHKVAVELARRLEDVRREGNYNTW